MINQQAIQLTIHVSSPVIFCFTVFITRTTIALNYLKKLFDGCNNLFFIWYIQYRLKYKMKSFILLTRTCFSNLQ